VSLMNDRDIELIHEVLNTYYKTGNADLIYQMTARVSNHLSLSKPDTMNELVFLQTIIKDYNYLTAAMG
jgi:hypothetical protein